MTRKKTLQVLRDFESRNVLFLEPDGSWPIVWERARGVLVWDAEGKKYLDLTAAFGVAAAGHTNPRVVAAGRKQMAKLLHAMGDVHPHARKAELARELSRVTFERWLGGKAEGQTGKTIFCNSGFEAVEAALKTALLVSGKPGVIVFEGAYHGLGYGTLNATHRQHFRGPFRPQLREFGHFVKFPVRSKELNSLEQSVKRSLRDNPIGAILVEPVQMRGGINIPPPEFLPLLRKLCDDHGVHLILDEIYTGFGRTGKWFACEHSGVAPDIICLGKALTGGFPLSACIGRADLMDSAWPRSTGEAIHTSTFLGHPVGCAMALAQIEELRKEKLPGRAARSGNSLLGMLSRVRSPKFKLAARGLGLAAGLELKLPDNSPATNATMQIVKEMLRRGFILLPEGEHGNVISFTPPLTITTTQLTEAVTVLQHVLNHE